MLISHGPAVGELDGGRYPAELHAELAAALRAVDHVVAVADHVATSLARLGAVSVETIRNVADPRLFRPTAKDARLMRALDLPPDAIVVGHVSVLRPWKRVADLVDSAALVLRSEPRCVYLIVGDGPCRAELEEHVRRHGLAAAFRFTGEIAHADVPRHLALADVVVQPSEREGAPLVYREAQACGRALLASNIAAAREAIEPGRTGFLFPKGDVAALAACTLELLRDADLRARIGAAARARVARDGTDAWLARYEAALLRAARRG
jgi:glycosyltransferase involved in cell wall biosynthesis